MNKPSRYVTYGLAGWLAGMTLNVLPPAILTYCVGIGAALLIVIIRHYKTRLWLVIGLFFLLANLHQSLTVTRITPQLDFKTPQRFWVTILDKPIKDNDRAVYLARAPDGWLVRITLSRLTVIRPGTEILIEGLLQPPTQDERVTQLRVAKNRIFARMSKPEILAERPATLNWWERLLVASRNQFDRTIQQLFVEPYGSLFAGIVAGLKSDLPQTVLDDFKTTGLSHIIAVSGFNVTIVMDLFTRFSQRFGRKMNFILSWVAILFFIFFTGASASVVRAGILAGLFVIARTIGRQTSIIRLLLITAGAMTLLNPLLLRYDIGFQLSFLAVIGLVVFADRISSVLAPLHLPGWLNETISATMAAQLTTTPIIIHYFGLVSVYSLPANILVGPLIPLLTIFGIPLILLVSLFPFLAWLYYPFDIGLHYIIWIVRHIAKLPYAQLTLPPLPSTVWLYYYATISLWALAIKPIEKEL